MEPSSNVTGADDAALQSLRDVIGATTAALRALRALRRRHNVERTALAALHRRERIDAVAAARGAGCTWQQIGTAFGVSRQTVHAQYSTTVEGK